MRAKSTGTITDTTPVRLPNPVSDRVCMYQIQLDFSGVTGGITIEGAVIDSNLTLIGQAYKNMNLGTNVAGGTEITATTQALVDASGLNLVLTSTVSAGTVTYAAIPLIG